MLRYYDQKFSEFEERAARIEADEGVQGGPLKLFLDVKRETAAAEISIGRVYPDQVTNLMRRGLPLMQRMFDYYRAQRTKMDADLEQLLVQRLEEQRKRISSVL